MHTKFNCSCLLIFIRCHCLDDAQTPPAVKRVCAAKNNAAMQIDEEEESKFNMHKTMHCIPHITWIHSPEEMVSEEILVRREVQALLLAPNVNIRLHDRFIVVGGRLRDKSNTDRKSPTWILLFVSFFLSILCNFPNFNSIIDLRYKLYSVGECLLQTRLLPKSRFPGGFTLN